MRIASSLKLGTLLFATSILFFSACNKSNTNASTDDVTSVSDQAMLERENADVDNISEIAYQTGSANLRVGPSVLGSCATVTNNTTVTPHILTIDFGTTNCLCADGRYRRGQIIVTYSGSYRDSGSMHTVTFNNYYVDDNLLTGKKLVTNMGRNSIGKLYYNISVNDSLHLTGGGIISWSSTRTRTWVDGESTTDRIDDVYTITGTGTLTRADGKMIDINITSPLWVAVNCNWIKKGTEKITRPAGGTMVVDFGSGNCDNKAQLTVGTHTYDIILHR